MAKKIQELAPADVMIAEDALMDFQFAVIKAMRDQNISQVELAEKLGISKGRMSQILSSDANPTLKVVGRIAAALGLEAEYVAKRKAPVEQAVKKNFTDLDSEWSVTSWAHTFVWHNDNIAERERSAEMQIPIAA